MTKEPWLEPCDVSKVCEVKVGRPVSPPAFFLPSQHCVIVPPDEQAGGHLCFPRRCGPLLPLVAVLSEASHRVGLAMLLPPTFSSASLSHLLSLPILSPTTLLSFLEMRSGRLWDATCSAAEVWPVAAVAGSVPSESWVCPIQHRREGPPEGVRPGGHLPYR